MSVQATITGLLDELPVHLYLGHERYSVQVVEASFENAFLYCSSFRDLLHLPYLPVRRRCSSLVML